MAGPSLVGQNVTIGGAALVVAAGTVTGVRSLNFADGSQFVSRLMGDGTEAVQLDTRTAAAKLAATVA